jgi:RNA polymerase-binding transcription factor DksA
MIDQATRSELHEQLLAERSRLGDEIAQLAGAASGTRFQEDESDALDQHPADDGSELFEREKNLSVQRTLEVTLQEVDDALRKYDEGTYGICDNCGEPIAEARLRAYPQARYCIRCQSELERGRQV